MPYCFQFAQEAALPAVARFDLKMDADEKDAVSRAAALMGTTMAAFVRVAAKEKAESLVKSFRGEAYEDSRFLGASSRYSKGMTRIQRLSLLSGPLTEVLGAVVALGILWVGAKEVLQGGLMDGGTLITFMVLVMRLLQPLKQMSQAPTIAQQSLAAAERLFDVLDEPTEAQLDKGTQLADGLHENIVFSDVGFAYGAEQVLSEISFSAKRGEVIALVGASGAG